MAFCYSASVQTGFIQYVQILQILINFYKVMRNKYDFFILQEFFFYCFQFFGHPNIITIQKRYNITCRCF